jgi:hypothetical protein
LKQALTIIVVALWATVAVANSNDFGTNGLIKMPDARMAADGTLRVTVAKDEVADLYNITFQALPRVQATFRYTIFNPKDLPQSNDGLRDRSYELKSLLLSESQWLPAVAVGARDVLGTGAWEAEYVVASKAWKNLDVSLGMGWGRLGSRSGFDNPLGVLNDRFDNRPTPRETGGRFGGESRGASFFRGEAALFGGMAYRFSKYPITLLAEYESDQYDREVRLRTLAKPSAMNFGVAWEPIPDIRLRGSWLRGDTFGLTLTAQLDTKRVAPRKVEKPRQFADLDPETGLPKGYNPRSWYDRMVFESEQTGLSLRAAKLKAGDTKATLEISNRSYNLTADALNQAMSLSERYLPARVSSVDFLLEEDGWVGPTVNYSLQRDSEVAAERAGVVVAASDKIKILAPRTLPDPNRRTDFSYPSLGFGADLAAKVQLMDPDDPARSQVYAKLTGRLQTSDHFNIWLRYEQNIYNDFNTDRPPGSVLPNVRTLVNRYLVEGESGIEQLYAEYKKSLSSSIHTRTYAGILEMMYGGVGSEVLYAPYLQRWALGVSVNAVRQRGFKRNFDFRDYETITGHVSAYYASPFYDIDMALHVGRYLAKDRGYTLEARRTFDSGFSVGGFFTRTNVSAEDFGEGSFDKGLFFRIPFDGLLPGNTRSAFSTILRSLERDGGRRLDNFGGSLWFDRRALRYDALDRNLNRMLPR